MNANEYADRILETAPDLRDTLNAVVSAHKGQERSDGRPFVIHPMRVARACQTVYQNTSMARIALAHDVLEDAPDHWGAVARTLTTGEAHRVRLLTKLPGAKNSLECEKRYMRGLAADPIAAAVKVEDRLDNILDMLYWSPSRRLRYVGRTYATFPPAMLETARGQVLREQLEKVLMTRDWRKEAHAND